MSDDASTRSTTISVTFRHPFRLEEIGRDLPAGVYDIETEEEAISGLSFLAYRRIGTYLYARLRAHSTSVEMWSIDPEDLEEALERDKAVVG